MTDRAPRSSSDRPRVVICIVSYDSEADLPGCLGAVTALDYRPIELVLVDCASRDRSVEVARANAPDGVDLQVIPLAENLGFTGGMNAALAASDAPLVLTLNPDARPRPDFLCHLERRIEHAADLTVGAVTGRLVRPDDESGHRRLDACGMRLTPTWRHLDRGSGRLDRGQYGSAERVFGATGAATLYVRAALDDVAIDGEVFDRSFHSYREDAEISFRLRERRWEVLYEPEAIAVHRRLNLPSRRRAMSSKVNMDSLKNRYLLRACHQGWRNFFLTLLPTLWRDLLALGYVLSRERTSLPAYAWLWRHRRWILERRRILRRRRTAGWWDVERWFWRSSLPLAPAPVPDGAPAVAIIGTRGIPACYGGFETLADELAPRLLARGLRVTVYCRSHYTPRGLREYRGVELVVLPTLRGKYLDTPMHTLFASVHAAARGFDAALVVNGANSAFLPILKMAGIPVAMNVDGIERQRAKWGSFGRFVYRFSERLAIRFSDELITDAETIRDYYRDRYAADSTLIAYGVDPRPLAAGETLGRLGLEPGGYFLYVSRFEPENNPHRVAEAYRSVGGELPLVMVGGAPYAGGFVRGFTEGADPRISFPGAIYGDGYRELLSNALAYVQASEVGGTHPALVEAMGYGNCVLVNDSPENREVAGDAGLYFRAGEPDTLARVMEDVRQAPELAAEHGRRAATRAREHYSWESVTDRYEELFRSLASA